MNFEVLLFYQYCHIIDTQSVFLWQRELAKRLGLFGRILIADEGINGTLSGELKACREYIRETKNYYLFSNMNFKKSQSTFIPFDSLKVKIKDEIVTLREDKKKISFEKSAKRLTPKEFHDFLSKKYKTQNDDIVILDARNSYETRIGRFSQSICPDVQNSREFRAYFENHRDLFKDKTVLMACTGGVRCERISVLFSDCTSPKAVYHLENGIHAYCQEYPDGYFRGKNYVFDDRISLKINDDVLSSCEICGISCDLYNNCLNAICNKHYIVCDACLKKMQGCCSQECALLTFQKSVPLRAPLKSRQL